MRYYISVAFLFVLLGWLFVPGNWRTSRHACTLLYAGVPRRTIGDWTALVAREVGKFAAGALLGGIVVGILNAILDPSHTLSTQLIVAWCVVIAVVGALRFALTWMLALAWYVFRRVILSPAAELRGR